MIRSFFPSSFVLQWHITERCNWSCQHCYREKDDIEELPLEDLRRVIIGYKQLLHTLKIQPYCAQLNIAGGEPFLRADIFDILEMIKRFNYFRVRLVTNGSFINRETVRKLKILGLIDRIQISIEGMQENNNRIRGEGSFKKIINAAKMLIRVGFRVTSQLTLSKQNVSDLPQLVSLCERLGVNTFAARRLVPLGQGKDFLSSILEPDRQRTVYLWRENERKKIERKRGGLRLWRGCEDGIFYQESISNQDSFLGNSCGVIQGKLLTIFPNGDVLLCRRLPVKIGNCLKNKLVDIYFSSNELWQLRNLKNAHHICKICPAFSQCLGGAKCITAAYFGKLSAPDPQCWRLFRSLPAPNLFAQEVEKKSINNIRLNSLCCAIENRRNKILQRYE